MTAEEFASSMERLRGVYGERFYPAGRVTAFWEELRPTESALWQAAIQRLVLEEAQPPMMKQIRMALAQEREKRYAADRKEEAKQAVEFFKNHASSCPPEVRSKFPHLFREVPKGGDDE